MELLGNTLPQECQARPSHWEALMGTAQAVLPHPAAALWVATGRSSHLCISGGVLCFSLLPSSVPLGFGISCRENLFLPPQHRSPHKAGRWHTWSSEELLCSCSKNKTSTSSQLGLPAWWLESSRTLPYLQQPCLSWFQMLLQRAPAPGAGGSLNQVSPGLVNASREALPPPQRAPRTFPWPHQSCRGLNKRKIRRVNVQQHFSDSLQLWNWAQNLNLWWGTPWHSCCYKARPNPHKWGNASS